KAEWFHGVVDVWRQDRKFGFIKSSQESFYFNSQYLFCDEMEIEEGRKVTFIALPPLANSKSRRASRIFVHGCKIRGKITHVPINKGYAFADVEGQLGEKQSLLVLIEQGKIISTGATVELFLDGNQKGPIGKSLEVLQPS
ncbi:MAG: hypothetical protein HQL52_16805, partial [Magnetococcales bacterium]|nr:hypothetical protein [Magnetococcales bacterium]